MLSREDFYMIKQLRKEGAHIVDIAHRLGCSERTVRRYLALPAPKTGRRNQPRGSKLDPFKSFIDQQACWKPASSYSSHKVCISS